MRKPVGIPAVLPQGFTLRDPVSYFVRTMSEMLASTEAWQDWCGVDSYEAGCRFISDTRFESDWIGRRNEFGEMLAPWPVAVIQRPPCTWSPLQDGTHTLEELIVHIDFLDQDRFEQDYHLSALEFTGRLGAVVVEMANLNGISRETGDACWPVLGAIKEIEPPILGQSSSGVYWYGAVQFSVMAHQ